MKVLATLRQQQQTRVGAALGLLLVVCLSLTLQSCASTVSGTESPAALTVAGDTLEVTSSLSGDAPAERCPICPDCAHERCIELASCDGPVVAAANCEVQLPETYNREPIAAVAGGEFEAALTSQDTSPKKQLSYPVTTAAVPLTFRDCIYQA